MSNGALKTTLGWLIVGSQIILLSLIVIFSLVGKLTEIERDGSLAAIAPQIATYLSAVVVYMLNFAKLRKTKFTSEKASLHTVFISLLLPSLISIGGFGLVIFSSMGQLETTSFLRYIALFQAAHIFICTTIYGHFFKNEITNLSKRH